MTEFGKVTRLCDVWIGLNANYPVQKERSWERNGIAWIFEITCKEQFCNPRACVRVCHMTLIFIGVTKLRSCCINYQNILWSWVQGFNYPVSWHVTAFWSNLNSLYDTLNLGIELICSSRRDTLDRWKRYSPGSDRNPKQKQPFWKNATVTAKMQLFIL